VTGLSWDIIVPLKELTNAKSRLVTLSPRHRRDLVVAMALDTLSAVVSCERPIHVHVVTDDIDLVDAVIGLDLGIAVHRGAPPGLNEAVQYVAGRLNSGAATGVLLADLPAVRGEDLAAVLDLAASKSSAVVADLDGSGSTFLSALRAEQLAPRFGPNSYRRHRQAGAVDIEASIRIRRDVDVMADLLTVATLELGPRTTAVAAEVLRGLWSSETIMDHLGGPA
jgi:2-phospho-L-lactate guanylyltransferase